MELLETDWNYFTLFDTVNHRFIDKNNIVYKSIFPLILSSIIFFILVSTKNYIMNIQVSEKFQSQVKKTLFSIFIFILVYLVLLILSIGITILFGYVGILAIINYPNVFTVGLGLGLIACGLTILFFLIKFIFASYKTDTSDLIEVKESEQPELFAMIHELVNEIKTDFPNKVFLSHNVNASVFYNSSFWSMFLPVKKNLQIGIGLINSLTRQELKAILAHEFGHFSQKSMKVGSYVYNVNNVIYNMLYNNESLNKMQEKLVNLSGYMALTLRISSISINGIQKILQKLYDYININYMALSREMEFHADEIAVNVAGSKALGDGLLRLSFANHSLESVIYFYQRKNSDNILPNNIYQDQSSVSLFLAKKNQYELNNGFPQVSIDAGAKYDKSKLIIENQWASHPSNEDRVKAINKLNIIVENPNDTPAIDILRNKEDLFKQIQHFLFAGLNHEGEINTLLTEQFQEQYEIDFAKNEFDEIYNEFYTYHNPIIKDFSKIDFDAKPINFEELFSDKNVELSIEVNSLFNDKMTLEHIQNGAYKLKTFDYDGVKYKAKEADTILNLVEEEWNDKQNQINEIDNQIFETFYQMAKFSNKEFELRETYNKFIKMDDEFDQKYQFSMELSENYAFVYQKIEYSDIVLQLSNNKPLESELKKEIADFINNDEIKSELQPETLKMLTHFSENELKYFDGTSYDDNNLNHLFTAIFQFQFLLSRTYFLQKQQLLRLQKEIYIAYKQ